MSKAARKVFIVAKVDPAEKAHVERTAKAEGLSISAVVRRAIKKDKAIHRAAPDPESPEDLRRVHAIVHRCVGKP